MYVSTQTSIYCVHSDYVSITVHSGPYLSWNSSYSDQTKYDDSMSLRHFISAAQSRSWIQFVAPAYQILPETPSGQDLWQLEIKMAAQQHCRAIWWCFCSTRGWIQCWWSRSCSWTGFWEMSTVGVYLFLFRSTLYLSHLFVERKSIWRLWVRLRQAVVLLRSNSWYSIRLYWFVLPQIWGLWGLC